MIWRSAFRYLRSQMRFLIFFTLNLSLGLTGFLTLETFRTSLTAVLKENSKVFLSADLSLSARRILTTEEIQSARDLLGEDRTESRLNEFFSMVVGPQGSRLAQIKAIEGNYPFYGNLQMGSGRSIESGTPHEIDSEPAVWVYPELLIQLNMKVGDQLQIGDASFRIADTVLEDSTQTFRLSSIAPKVYVSMTQIQKANLIKRGATFSDVMLFKLPLSLDVPSLAKKLLQSIPDPGVQVLSYKEAGEESAKPLAYLSDYLGLVSLVSLFLSLVGSAFLYRSFFSRQIRTIAIYNVLGLQMREIVKILLLQVVALGSVSCLLSLVGTVGLFPILKLALQAVSPLQIPLSIGPATILSAVGLSTVGALLISIFYLMGLSEFKPLQIFQEEFQTQVHVGRRAIVYLIIPITFFVMLAVAQAHSWKMGLLFSGLFFGSLILILFFNYFSLVSLGKIFSKLHWTIKHAGLQLRRKIRQNLSSSIALSLGALLMTLLPQLKMSIQQEMEMPTGTTLPSLFLFDIQDEQIQGVKDLMTKMGFTNLEYSPMVRGRLLTVNGERFERMMDESKMKTREEETESRFRNRGFNLSYREKLHRTETIVEGKYWDRSFDPAQEEFAEISVELGFANRLKLKLGDILLFDVQGVEVKGKVTSFRSVRWNSFQPNFFVNFQPGVLNEAPKSWLVAVPKSMQFSAVEIQDKVAKEFPNVSAVDVARTVTKILSMIEKMSWSLQLMAFLCFFTGFFVLYSVVTQQVQESRWDLNLQKILGASFAQSGSQVWIQYGVLGFISSAVGSLLSLGVAYFLGEWFFEIPLVCDMRSFVWTILGATLISVLISFFASWKLVREKAQIVLQS